MNSKKQREAFVNKAREIECNEDPEVFEKAFKKIVQPKKQPEKKPKD